ncbi:MAG: hypothetical protein ACRET2_14930 [Steroidobacteraceae bacterium]
MSSFIEIRRTIESTLAGEEEQFSAEERELRERLKALRRRRGLIERRRRALERFAAVWRELPEPEVEWPPQQPVEAAVSEVEQKEEIDDVAAGG